MWVANVVKDRSGRFLRLVDTNRNTLTGIDVRVRVGSITCSVTERPAGTRETLIASVAVPYEFAALCSVMAQIGDVLKGQPFTACVQELLAKAA